MQKQKHSRRSSFCCFCASSFFRTCLCRFAAGNPRFCCRLNCFNEHLCLANQALKQLSGRC